MGRLQAYFYLGLIGALGVAIWLALVGVGLTYVARGLRAGQDRLVMVLAGGALVAVLVFVALAVLGAALSISFYLSSGRGGT